MKKIIFKAGRVRLFVVLLAALAVFLTFRNSSAGPRASLLAAEGAFLVLFTLLPRVFFPVFRLVLTATGYLGDFLFRVITVAVFFLILTPVSLVMRLFGKSFLAARIDRDARSYYEPGSDNAGMDKQF